MIEQTGESFEGKPTSRCSRAADAPAADVRAGAEGAEGEAETGGIMGRLFGSRPSEVAARGATSPSSAADSRDSSPTRAEAVAPSVVEPERIPNIPSAGASGDSDGPSVSIELGDSVQTGFQDLSRLLGAIKETLSSRDGPVQQTLQALPDFLQQVPRIHRAEIECLAQISKQLEHMGSGTKDVVARLEGLPDLLRSLMLSQTEQARYLDNLQGNFAEALETQGQALREGLETSRKSTETQLQMIRSIATTQEGTFATFQNTQNRALNVFHRAQQQTIQQNKDAQRTMNRQIETLVDRVHIAQGRVFWLSIGFAALAAAGLLAVLFLSCNHNC